MANRYQINKKPKLSSEEMIYQEAMGLLESIECITRFEWEVRVLKKAIILFGKLEGYKDAAIQKNNCEKELQKCYTKGYQSVFKEAVKKQEEAVYKSDYADAIADFKRVLKSDTFADEARERIAVCKKKINRIETKAVWKRRGIMCIVFAVLVVIFCNTPAFPFTKGYILQKQGKYEAALRQYKQAEDFPFTRGRMQICHLAIGKQLFAQKKTHLALKEFRKAGENEEAQKYAAKIEKRILKKKMPGDIVRFGKVKWCVLSNENGKVLLLYQNKGKKVKYYNTEEPAGFEESHIARWLNRIFCSKAFSESEKKLLLQSDGQEWLDVEAAEKETVASAKSEQTIDVFVSLLSKEDYLSYREMLQPVPYSFWLREVRESGLLVNYVNEQGNLAETYGNQAACLARPVVCVKVR